MFAVLVVAMVLILLWAAISPESMWSTTSAWQYRDPEANEPSDAAYAVQRVGEVHRTDRQHVDHLASKAMVPWKLVAKK